MSARWDVLALGAVAVDEFMYMDGYPAPNTKMRLQAEQRQGGGLAGTALVAAARLGASVAYCGVLGNDEFSSFTLQELEREGVACTLVVRWTGARPFHSFVIIDRGTGQRTILYSSDGVTGLQPKDLPDEIVAKCRVLFVDHTVGEAGLQATRFARAHGIPIVADIELETAPAVEELMRKVDHLIVGFRLAARLTGETNPDCMLRGLLSAERACCVVTAGERGCWYLERGGEVRHVPAYPVQVVDTTGCGDVFHGAYAACLAEGQSIDMAIQVATATAGLKATQLGGRAGIPHRPAVDRFLRENQVGISGHWSADHEEQ